MGACSDGTLRAGTNGEKLGRHDAGAQPDEGTDAPVCTRPAPAAAQITTPENDVENVVAREMIVTLSNHPVESKDALTEVEIWKDSGGAATRLVWSASVTDSAKLTRLTLADGEYHEGTALKWGKRYQLRARFGDTGGECVARSAWSDPVRFKTVEGDDYLFDQTRVHSMYLDIPPNSFAQIDAEAGKSTCGRIERTYRRGSLRFEDQVVQDIGIRAKGGCGSSRASTDNEGKGKTPFKLKFEWDDPDVPGCPAPRKFMNLKRLTLNNAVTDPSLVHERLTAHFYQALGIPNSRTAHVRVYVNDEYWGLYVLTETIDRRMLGRHFASKEGMLYEGAYYCDLYERNMPNPSQNHKGCLEQKFNPDPCDGPPKPGADPQTLEPLKTLIDQVEDLSSSTNYFADLAKVFDVDAFLGAWAMELVTSNWDNYQRLGNNYRVYHDPSTDLWTIITSGFDQGWSGDGVDPWENLEKQNNGAITQIYTLGKLCLEDAACEAALVQKLLDVAQRMEQLDYRSVLDTVYQQIRSHVYEDPRKETDNGGFDYAITRIDQWIGERPNEVRDLLRSRNLIP